MPIETKRMIDNPNTPKQKKPYLQLAIAIGGLVALLSSYVIFFIELAQGNLEEWVFAVLYLLMTLLLAINIRTQIGFILFMGKRIFKSALSPYIVGLFYLVMSEAITKNSFNKMPLYNYYIIGISAAMALLLSIAMIYKNNNLQKTEYTGKIYRAVIVMLSIFMGYGFSLVLNCSCIVDSSEQYTLPIANKYIGEAIQRGRYGHGIVHVKHFVVKSWPYSIAFGNDIEVAPRWYDKFPNLEDITVGDRLTLEVHHGLLHLDWIEPLYFEHTPDGYAP